MTLGSHQQCIGKSQGHISPLAVLKAIGAFGDLAGLPPIDLDPCAADPRPWDCARVNWTSHGLERDWPRDWSVYMNPPFHKYQVGAWIQKSAEHGNGIVLLHARPEAAWFEPCWRHAAVILFLADRLKFCFPDGQRARELARARVLDLAGAPDVQMELAGRLTGHCCVCMKELSDPVSLERGIGPDCYAHRIDLIHHIADDFSQHGQVVDAERVAQRAWLPMGFVTEVLKDRTSFPNHSRL
jgi:hypothetical protein